MPCSSALRTAAQKLPAFRIALEQLSLLNSFDICAEHARRIHSCREHVEECRARARGHIAEALLSCDSCACAACKGLGRSWTPNCSVRKASWDVHIATAAGRKEEKVEGYPENPPTPHFAFCGNFDPAEDLEWLLANDPRFQDTFLRLTDYAKFARLVQFQSLCVHNLNSLMGVFELGGDGNMLDSEGGGWRGDEDYVDAMNILFQTSPRHHHLLLDLATLAIACEDLSECSERGPFWFRNIFQGLFDHPNSGSSFSMAEAEKVEEMYAIATENTVRRERIVSVCFGVCAFCASTIECR